MFSYLWCILSQSKVHFALVCQCLNAFDYRAKLKIPAVLTLSYLSSNLTLLKTCLPSSILKDFDSEKNSNLCKF